MIITGQSAGAAAVVHLMASELAKGLFHGVIACSGTAFQEWAITDEPIKNSLYIAEKIGCYTPEVGVEPNKTAIVECMQNEPAAKLVEALTEYTVSRL